MAAEGENGQEKTEEPTDERREEFRKKGDVAHSKEITSVFVLISVLVFLTFYFSALSQDLVRFMYVHLENSSATKITEGQITGYIYSIWTKFFWYILPIASVTIVISTITTFTQTRINISWKRITPNVSRLNPISGLGRIVSGQALLELFKGIGKICAISLVAWLILYGERTHIPSLLLVPFQHAWKYWGDITVQLFWAIAFLLLIIAIVDYSYNHFQLEKKMKMTKEEVKEDISKREGKQLTRFRQRRGRDVLMSKMMNDLSEATVVITNPTHYAIALKFEIGMTAPIVIAKGVDELALQIREVAKEKSIPMVENPPLARSLYSTSEIGEMIPIGLYKAVSEVIRYVFKLRKTWGE